MLTRGIEYPLPVPSVFRLKQNTRQNTITKILINNVRLRGILVKNNHFSSSFSSVFLIKTTSTRKISEAT